MPYFLPRKRLPFAGQKVWFGDAKRNVSFPETASWVCALFAFCFRALTFFPFVKALRGSVWELVQTARWAKNGSCFWLCLEKAVTLQIFRTI